MDLIERARTWDQTNQHPDEAQRLLNELAGEIERLWAFEKDIKTIVLPTQENSIIALRARLAAQGAEWAAEVKALKATVDTAGMMRKWLDGYSVAVSQFQPIMFNLLRACDTLPPEPTEEDPE